MNSAVWSLEWKLALRRRRVLAFSVGVPLLLVAVLALGHAPAPHAALVFTILFIFFGTFGAAVPWARDAERGLLHRFILAGVGMPALATQRLLASALIDWVELTPSLAIIAIVYRPSLPDLASLALATLFALLAANALGALVASFAKSLAETALLAAVSALLLMHAAGVFRVPEPGTIADTVQRAVPFYYLSVAMRTAVGAP